MSRFDYALTTFPNSAIINIAGPTYCLFDHFSTGMKRRKIRDDGSMSPGLHYKPKSRTERSHKKSRSWFSGKVGRAFVYRCPRCCHQLRLSGGCESLSIAVPPCCHHLSLDVKQVFLSKLEKSFSFFVEPKVQPFVSALALFLLAETLCESPLLEEILLTKLLLYFMVVTVYAPPWSRFIHPLVMVYTPPSHGLYTPSLEGGHGLYTPFLPFRLI